MRTVLYILTTFSVIGLAFWAYRENYATQQALRYEIREAYSRLAVLKAEWAYQNRPDRLRDLAELNFDRLNLLPLHPDQFGSIDQMSYPPLPELPLFEITDGVDVSSMEAPE